MILKIDGNIEWRAYNKEMIWGRIKRWYEDKESHNFSPVEFKFILDLIVFLLIS